MQSKISLTSQAPGDYIDDAILEVVYLDQYSIGDFWRIHGIIMICYMPSIVISWDDLKASSIGMCERNVERS